MEQLAFLCQVSFTLSNVKYELCVVTGFSVLMAGARVNQPTPTDITSH